MVVLESGLIKAEKNPAIHCVAWHHYMSSQSHLVTRQDIYWFGYLLDILDTCTGHLQSRDINLEISAGLDIYLLIRYLEVGNLITRYILARYTIQTRYGSPHRPDIPGCQGEEGTYDAWCHDTGVWYEMKDSFPEERARGAHSRYSEECVQTAQVNTGGVWQAWCCDARFDSHFDPEKHNLYLKRHLLAQTKSEESREEKVTTIIQIQILQYLLSTSTILACRFGGSRSSAPGGTTRLSPSPGHCASLSHSSSVE